MEPSVNGVPLGGVGKDVKSRQFQILRSEQSVRMADLHTLSETEPGVSALVDSKVIPAQK